MSENLASSTPAVPELLARLQVIARLLRQADSVDALSRQSLAELVDEMKINLETKHLPAAELTHLGETTVHLEETLRHHQDQGVAGRAREGFERIVGSAEAKAPFAVGVARRLLETLANIGI